MTVLTHYGAKPAGLWRENDAHAQAPSTGRAAGNARHFESNASSNSNRPAKPLRYASRIELRGLGEMMIHHMLSVTRRATPPSGASLTPVATAPEKAEPAEPAPSPAAGPVTTYGPASALAATAMTDARAGAQVALPTALAAYQEFTE